MASFTIDDVRDTLRSDVLRLIGHIDQSTSEVLASPELPDRSELFVGIGDDGHALFGTTSLVGADSIAMTAKLVEELAERGRALAADAAQRAEGARMVADMLRRAASEMRTMLHLELEHHADDAQWIAMSWQDQARDLVGAVEQRVAPRPDPDQREEEHEEEGFSFEEPEPPAAATVSGPPPSLGEEHFSFEDLPADASFGSELLDVFRTEARESVVALQGWFRSLVDDPSNAAALGQIERVFHTLKGAAATVGLTAVAARASDLQDRTEAALDRDVAPTREDVSLLVTLVDELCDDAGLPRVGPITPGAALEQAAPRELFVAEARRTHTEASRLLERLARGDDPKAKLLGLAELMHRLKGSALLARHDEVASEAIKIEELCAHDPTISSLARGLARIAAAIGAPPSMSVGSEAGDLFRVEARQICEDARTILVGPEPSRLDFASRLGALLHRLKGSALLAAEDAIAHEAAALEAICEASRDGTTNVARMEEGIAAIEALLGVRGPAPSIDRPLPEERVRESVTVATDPELMQAFEQECAELLESLDQKSLQLEESDAPKQLLEAIMRDVHTLKGVVNTIGLTPTGRELHVVEDFLEELQSAAVLPSLRAIASLLLRVQVDLRKQLQQSRQGFVETSVAGLAARIRALSAPERAPAAAPADRSVASADSGQSAQPDEARRFIRVPTMRLDALMDLAGELVISRSRLTSRVAGLGALHVELGRGSRRLVETVDAFREEYEFAQLDGKRAAMARAANDGSTWAAFSDLELDRYDDVHVLARRLAEITNDFTEMSTQLARGISALSEDADGFGGIIAGIQTEVTRARMVPVEVLFGRLRLPVRDAAVREGKDVRVHVVGEEVTVDKIIADALFQPMLHLVRNAVAHGVESSTARAAHGKASHGTVELRARQESGHIVIEVHDDGSGLDLARLKARGVAMGLVSPEMSEDDPAIRDLVFAKGLSTRATGAVAGRGVGCDVVRRAIERLNGSIVVESTPGRGTTFTITLPVTLAITKALLVREGKRAFAVPLYFAERILDADEATIVDSAGLLRVKVDDGFVPVKRLSELLGSEARGGPIVVLRIGDTRLALEVQSVAAQEEIVVKPLGELLAGHPLFAGVTIRGTGELVLILDVPRLFEGRAAARVRAVTPEKPKRSDESAIVPIVEEPSIDAQASRVRALFVDDSLSVRKVAENALGALGVDVQLAVDGLDALAKLREHTFDIVFTDLEMPRMHGYELIRELRFLPAYRELPIVVVTSRTGQKHQEQARSLGATDYLTKPFTQQTLEAAVHKFVRRRGDAT